MIFTVPIAAWVGDDLIAERGENAGFQMFTRDGNDAVADTLAKIIRDGEVYSRSRRFMVHALKDGIATLTANFPEVHDTEPEWAIVDAMNAYFDTEGWIHISRDDLS